MTMPTQPGLNAYGTAGDPAVSGAGTGGVSTVPPPAAASPATSAPAAASTPAADYDQLNREATQAIDRYASDVKTLGERASQLYIALSKVDQNDQLAVRNATTAYDS